LHLMANVALLYIVLPQVLQFSPTPHVLFYQTNENKSVSPKKKLFQSKL
jgi:hypothetical protein